MASLARFERICFRRSMLNEAEDQREGFFSVVCGQPLSQVTHHILSLSSLCLKIPKQEAHRGHMTHFDSGCKGSITPVTSDVEIHASFHQGLEEGHVLVFYGVMAHMHPRPTQVQIVICARQSQQVHANLLSPQISRQLQGQPILFDISFKYAYCHRKG